MIAKAVTGVSFFLGFKFRRIFYDYLLEKVLIRWERNEFTVLILFKLLMHCVQRIHS